MGKTNPFIAVPPCNPRRWLRDASLAGRQDIQIAASGAQPLSGSSPVVIRVLLSIAAFRSDSADNVLSVCTHQLHRMDGQVLVQISTALSSIGAQVAFVFSLF